MSKTKKEVVENIIIQIIYKSSIGASVLFLDNSKHDIINVTFFMVWWVISWVLNDIRVLKYN